LAEKEKQKRNLDEAFIFAYNYSWIRDKLITNEVIVNFFDDFLKILYDNSPFRFRTEQREGFLMMTKMESIISAVKYSEDLAAISVGFGKGPFKLNETLRTYTIPTVKGFFKTIPDAKYDYIRNILGYPEWGTIEEERRDMMRRSAEEAKLHYKQIAAFYDKNADLYNCYKHGLRLMPALGERQGDHMLLKFPSMKNGEFDLEGFDQKEFETEYANALKTAGLVFTLMDVIIRNHRALYFGKTAKYECLVIPPSE
jgi:hypothetical protein